MVNLQHKHSSWCQHASIFIPARPLPPTLDFVNSNLSSNPFEIKGLQVHEIFSYKTQTTIHKACQAALLTSMAHDSEILGLWWAVSSREQVADPRDEAGWETMQRSLALLSCERDITSCLRFRLCGCTSPAQPVALTSSSGPIAGMTTIPRVSAGA